jgi:hypothetical protein
VPAPGALFDSIERFVEFEYGARLAIKALRYLDIEMLVRLAIQESAFDVHLVYFKIIERSESEKYLQRGESPSGGENVGVVTALFLEEAPDTESCFEFGEISVLVSFSPENPSGGEGMHVFGLGYNSPDVMFFHVAEFGFDGQDPVFFVDGHDSVIVGPWVFLHITNGIGRVTGLARTTDDVSRVDIAGDVL